VAEIVNLRLARKAKARVAAAAKADSNRAKFGRSKAEKAAVAKETARLARDLDRAKRE
jgi:hypothetical protein